MEKTMTEVMKTVTPKGELAWVTHQGEGKENMSGKMQYVASLILDPINNKEHKDYIVAIDSFWEANKPEGRKKAKSLGYKLSDPLLDDKGEKQYDDDDKLIYDPKGRVTVTFKTGTTWPDGKTKVVKIYNSKNKIVSLGDASIGNGSIGHLSGAIGIYINKNKQGKIMDAGATLYLDAIQLKKFVEYTGGDAGFAASEDEDEDAFVGVDEDAGFDGEDAPTPRL